VVFKERFRIFRPVRYLPLLFTLLLTQVGCSVLAGNSRPDDSKLRDGIKLLISDFTQRHPDLISWKVKEVERQISEPLPAGLATEAGWTLTWLHPSIGEFSRVVIPWSILGKYPDVFAQDAKNYSGGKLVPDSVATQIRHLQQGADIYFAAIVNLRYSAKDAHWLIFTSIPYLPITDDAYGWAHFQSGKWQITDFGTATVGCGRVPVAIQAEFGMSCPTDSKKG
jgi:hypothetical protein